MIKFTVICKSKHWPARVKKISSIVKKILKFKKDLIQNQHDAPALGPEFA